LRGTGMSGRSEGSAMTQPAPCVNRCLVTYDDRDFEILH
jgi:hypothetical protein